MSQFVHRSWVVQISHLFLRFFLGIQRATLSDHGPALNSERNGDRAAFIVAVVVLVVPVEDVSVEVVVVFEVDMILEAVVALAVVGLANALIVAEAIILWIIVGIYMAHHLGSPIRLLLKKILQPPLDHLLSQASIWSVI
jgi:hypothetical protein